MKGNSLKIGKPLFLLIFIISGCSCHEIYIKEEFSSSLDFANDWTISRTKMSENEDALKYQGPWEVTQPSGDIFKGDNVLLANEPLKHYSASRKLKNVFKFLGESLIVQYEFMFPPSMSCGGAYIKLLSNHESNEDLSKINENSPYSIMFGPDICGHTKKIHFIFRHLNPITKSFDEKHLIQPDIKKFSHIFSDGKFHHLFLQIDSDNSFIIQLDGSTFASGSLLLDFTPAVNPPEFIDDQNDVKPDDWDDRKTIPDTNAVKPADWDESEPSTIPDPLAKMPEGWVLDAESHLPDPSEEKPSDWNDEIDGEWSPSVIPNPACIVGCGPWSPPEIQNPKFKGKWSPPLIDNPNYKGVFKPKTLKNPEYFYDPEPYRMTDISSVTFELWIVTGGVAFDNILITDDISYSKSFASKIISSRASVYRMKKVKDVASSKLTLQILTAVIAGLVFLSFIYYKFLRTAKVQSSSENVEPNLAESSEKTGEENEKSDAKPISESSQE